MRLKRLPVVLSVLTLCAIASCDTTEEDIRMEPIITVRLTVEGEIQTTDPWTTGPVEVNDWAKPIYRVWFDPNGNPYDGPHGNGLGPKTAEIWLDTGRLGFHWYGEDGEANTADDEKLWPLMTISDSEQVNQQIAARIIPAGGTPEKGETLEVRFPLRLIGNPSTLDVGFMASPLTTSACDNVGRGANANICWMVIHDAMSDGTYSIADAPGDRVWPELEPNHSENFDLTHTEVIIVERARCPS